MDSRKRPKKEGLEPSASGTRRSDPSAASSPIEERYEVEREIARGGMGVIYSVWDKDLKRHAAMKVALSTVEPTEEMSDSDTHSLGRFLNEARITSQLEHPGIPPVYQIGRDAKGRDCLVMRFVEGVTLLDVIRHVHGDREEWNLTRALWVVLKVCEAMAYAHSRGFAHRDLKAENIMVGRFGETYVMDWGLAAPLGDATDLPVVGTPAYMAPECARGTTELRPQADVYSLGSLLYHVVSGHMPYRNDAYEERSIIERVLEEPPTPLLELAPWAPRDLTAICEKAMAREPDDRYASVVDMAVDLRAFLEGRVVAAYETGVAAEVRKWVARNRPTAAALAALVVGVLASIAVFMWFQQHSYELLAAEKERTEVARDEAVSVSYAANLRAAAANLRAFETGEAKRRLQSCTRGLRDWEWAHLSWRSDTSALRLEGHIDGVRAVAFDPTGSCLASGSADATIRLWDAWTGATRHVLEGHAGKVNAVAFSPDGAQLASGSEDYTVRVWDVANGELVHVLQDSPSPIRALAVDPLGTTVVGAAEDGVLRIWDLETGELVRMVGREDGDVPVDDISMSSDGRRALGTHGGRAVLWDLATGKELRSFGVRSHFRSIAFHPSGERFVGATPFDMLEVWDLERGEPVRVLEGHSSHVKDVAWSPDGTSIVSVARDNTLRMWQLDSDGSPTVFLGHDDDVDCVTFSPDGAHVATGSSDNTVRIWSTGLAATNLVRSDTGWTTETLFDGTGKRLVSVQYSPHDHASTLAVTDVETRSSVFEQTLPGRVDCAAISADGEHLWVGLDGRGIQAWEVSTGLPETPPNCDPEVVLLDLDLVGDRLLGATKRGELLWWDLTTGVQEGRFRAHDASITVAALSPTGRRAVTGARDGTARVWDLVTGTAEHVLEESTGPVDAVAWSADGFVVTGSSDRMLRLWNPTTGELVRSFNGHEDSLTGVTVHPDGRRIASSSRDATIRVWDLRSGELLLTLRDHEFWVTSVAFSPDGRRLASGSVEEGVRLWLSATTDP